MRSLPTDTDYAYLLELRTGLRRFLHWSEEQAKAVGLTAVQHQLLLAIRGHRGRDGPAISDIADQLLLRHHSAVELVDRAEVAGLVRRCADPDRYRVVRLTLTPRGAETLERLAAQHLEELAHLAPAMELLWRALEQADDDDARRHPAARPTPPTEDQAEQRSIAAAPSESGAYAVSE